LGNSESGTVSKFIRCKNSNEKGKLSSPEKQSTSTRAAVTSLEKSTWPDESMMRAVLLLLLDEGRAILSHVEIHRDGPREKNY
jgi:hypothetical protein